MKKTIVTLFGVVLLSGCAFKFAPGDKGIAYIYENRKTGELLYCSNNEGAHVRDFKYVGTGKLDRKLIKHCELERFSR